MVIACVCVCVCVCSSQIFSARSLWLYVYTYHRKILLTSTFDIHACCMCVYMYYVQDLIGVHEMPNKSYNYFSGHTPLNIGITYVRSPTPLPQLAPKECWLLDNGLTLMSHNIMSESKYMYKGYLQTSFQGTNLSSLVVP